MKRICLFSLLIFPALLLMPCSILHAGKRPGKPHVLVFSKTAGYHHASIAYGIEAIQTLGIANGFEVDTTADASWFTEDTLKHYAAVVFMSTTHEVLDKRQQAEFERYIQAGGGYVGVHAAADGGYTWPWYGKLVGAYFNHHTAGKDTLHVARDKKIPATYALPDPWIRHDEWYSFRKAPQDVHVLVTMGKSSGKGDAYHPLVWYHSYDGGRAFYIALGHTNESYSEPDFLKLLLGGIKYAIDGNKKLNYRKAHTQRISTAP